MAIFFVLKKQRGPVGERLHKKSERLLVTGSLFKGAYAPPDARRIAVKQEEDV
tara:strand:+ start:162 stop:320 length:159 start_codon:yes stop_codon:yes gene_type:complete